MREPEGDRIGDLWKYREGKQRGKDECPDRGKTRKLYGEPWGERKREGEQELEWYLSVFGP